MNTDSQSSVRVQVFSEDFHLIYSSNDGSANPPPDSLLQMPVARPDLKVTAGTHPPLASQLASNASTSDENSLYSSRSELQFTHQQYGFSTTPTQLPTPVYDTEPAHQVFASPLLPTPPIHYAPHAFPAFVGPTAASDDSSGGPDAFFMQSPAKLGHAVDSNYRFPSPPQPVFRAKTRASPTPSSSSSGSSHTDVCHPYSRPNPGSKKDAPAKRRKMWNHALEKSLFTPQELQTLGAPHRRTIYTASLEAHIDRLHAQLLDIDLYPVPFDKLEPYRGLNSKTAKSMVAGLYKDASDIKLATLELQRSNYAFRTSVLDHDGYRYPLEGSHMGPRRHSVDDPAVYSYPNLFAR